MIYSCIYKAKSLFELYCFEFSFSTDYMLLRSSKIVTTFYDLMNKYSNSQSSSLERKKENEKEQKFFSPQWKNTP